MKVSKRLKLEVLKQRAAGKRVSDLARAAGIHRTTFGSILSGAFDVEADDPRLIRICKALRFPIRAALEPAKRGAR